MNGELDDLFLRVMNFRTDIQNLYKGKFAIMQVYFMIHELFDKYFENTIIHKCRHKLELLEIVSLKNGSVSLYTGNSIFLDKLFWTINDPRDLYSLVYHARVHNCEIWNPMI